MDSYEKILDDCVKEAIKIGEKHMQGKGICTEIWDLALVLFQEKIKEK